MPRGCWPKGRVTKTYPGTDGLVRVADVLTQWGTFRRPVSKLCVLDVNNGDDDSTSPHEGDNVVERDEI